MLKHVHYWLFDDIEHGNFRKRGFFSIPNTTLMDKWNAFNLLTLIEKLFTRPVYVKRYLYLILQHFWNTHVTRCPLLIELSILDMDIYDCTIECEKGTPRPFFLKMLIWARNRLKHRNRQYNQIKLNYSFYKKVFLFVASWPKSAYLDS